MLKLSQYKLIFVAVGLVGVLLFASPLLSISVRAPLGESFSEFYVLGPGRMMEDYPFNIKTGTNYTVYLGVNNHVGSSAYYACYVKLRNQTEPLPNATSGMPSPLAPLYEYRVFLEDGKSWEASLTFSVSNASVSGDESFLRNMSINGVGFDVGKQAKWDSEESGFYYEFVVELWRYDAGHGMGFDSRYVHFWLNVTGAS